MSRDDVPLNKHTPYGEYEGILSSKAVTVKANPKIANRRDEPLFRITVIADPAPDKSSEFALVASMSHVCGDGHTFYRIYHMILGSAPIVPLIPQRELSYDRQVMNLMGRREANYISHISTDPAWMKFFRLGSDVSGGGDADELRGRVFLVNRHWITSRKASYMIGGDVDIAAVCTSTLRSPMTPASLEELQSSRSRDPTQSTNDILVSWFWNLVGPHVGLMAVNFRQRLDIVGDDHAGNYVNPIPYTPEDYKSANLIRRSLETCRRAGAAADGEAKNETTTALPRPNSDLTFSVISNWSSFLPVVMDERSSGVDGGDWNNGREVTLIRHLPIVYPERMIETMPKRMSFLIIFSSGPDDIGCVLIAPGRIMEEIDGCGVVEEKIAEF